MRKCDGIRGYIEGYYGRLLSWPQRRELLDHLQQCGMNHYWYAPKEDIRHRLHWRRPYAQSWRDAFAQFCQRASRQGVSVVAGMAPGLDFDFAHLSAYCAGERDADADNDMSVLVKKSRELMSAGAAVPALLLDDIDADFPQRCGDFNSEGAAHAQLANQLGEALGLPLWVVPRIYADELASDAPGYLPDFVTQLDPQHTIVYCGSHIVTADINPDQGVAGLPSSHSRVYWDNLYANDYCPRKLYLGPWSGRSGVQHIMLNPTGLPETDKLLLSVMTAADSASTGELAWRKTLVEAGVPDVFFSLRDYFDHPPVPGQGAPTLPVVNPAEADAQMAALEQLLWRWKTSLSREWYQFLMSLKHDLLLANDELAFDRIVKTQSIPLTARLLGDKLNQRMPE
ncbi:MAG: beta-N-acetylglucosaminidase domain-containing protein [Gammaproteobacteria bacterium]|nr:beta-N-acetylglucosaminidase domain-containing protein [Gammaproteobacteria bacterium]